MYSRINLSDSHREREREREGGRTKKRFAEADETLTVSRNRPVMLLVCPRIFPRQISASARDDSKKPLSAGDA